MNEAVRKLIPDPTVQGLNLPAPSSKLTEAKNQLDELQAQRTTLIADMDTDERLIKSDIQTLAAASKEEQDILRKIAIEPNDKAHRESLDEVRGIQLTTKDSLENRKALNLSRAEVIAELNMEMAGSVKRVRSLTNGYHHDLYNHFESELLAEINPLMTKLSALRLLAGFDPHGGYLPDIGAIDSLANKIREKISENYGL